MALTNQSVAQGSWIPETAQEQDEVRAELERILASAPFRNSRRYPSLLRYVVEKTLGGECDDLKERTLGIEVFHRPLDYDTSADPVVRFSAGEVRRRLAQFYQGHPSEGVIEIGLPAGSYIPTFHRIVATSSTAQFDHPALLTNVDCSPLFVDMASEGALSEETAEHRALPWRPLLRYRQLLAGFALGICLTALAVWFASAWTGRLPDTPLMDLWAPMLKNTDTVLISVGRTHYDDGQLPETSATTIAEHILRPEARISFASVQAITQLSGFLETQHRSFHLNESFSTNLQDLRGFPVVLVNGYNNNWTMRLLRPLRFHLVQQGAFHYIEDSEHPERKDWSVDFAKPYLQQSNDYAIVARFYDPTTGGPVLIVAGIGSNGTQAAGDFVVSANAMEALAHSVPGGALKKNFEAILKVEVIGGHTGATTVVATNIW